MYCIDCDLEGDEDDPGCGHPTVYCSCHCHDDPSDREDYDGRADEDGPCMGDANGCVNPHPMHTYRECCTVEMMEPDKDRP